MRLTTLIQVTFDRRAFASKTFKLKKSQAKKFSYFLHQLQIHLQNAIKDMWKITHTDVGNIINNLIKTHASMVKLTIKVDKHLHGVP